VLDRKQFVLVKFDLDPLKPGKLLKRPLNRQLQVANALDPSNWMGYQEALAATAGRPDLGLGFVLTNEDPYFCLDIDNCLMPDNTWSTLASELCAMFPGAFIETSVGGRGIHIWGSYASMPPHGCKNTVLGLELYHSDRFIVINHAYPGNGNAALEWDAILAPFIKKYFKPTALQAEPNQEWTAAPVAHWAGHVDDDKLIEYACTHASFASIFGDTVSFRDLWEKNVPALVRKWGSASGAEGYDASSADASLAQRLAYYTGKDCERTLRLMRQSSLVREKWDARADYLTRTILTACARQEKVDSSQAKADGKDGFSRAISGGGWVDRNGLAELFKGHAYVISQHKAVRPDGSLVGPEQFKALFGSYKFQLDDQRTSRNAWEAFTCCPTWRPDTVHDTVFMPDEPEMSVIERHGRFLFNTWRKPVFSIAEGDVSRFTRTVEYMLADERDRRILLSYMAACVQYPGKKFSWAVVLQGPKGSCKSFMNRCLIEAFGSEFSYSPKMETLSSRNNGWIDRKLFAGVEELMVPDLETENAIKTLITEEYLALEEKYVAQKAGQNRCNFMFTTNFMNGIRIAPTERRYCPISLTATTPKAAADRGLTAEFMADLWDWAKADSDSKYAGKAKGWAVITNYLLNYKIDPEFNPAAACKNAPKSSSWFRFIEQSLGSVEQEIIEACEQEMVGFAGGWISSIWLDRLLTSKRLARKVPVARRKDMLFDLGYVVHPALPDGRSTRVVMPDGGRPKLFIRADHIKAAIEDPAKAVAQYVSDQTAASNVTAGAGAAVRPFA